MEMGCRSMYQVGDLIVYGGNGVCRVAAVGPGPRGGRFYTLEPVYQSCTIMTPVDNQKVFHRPIITRQEALSLIDDIPTIQAQAYHSKVMRELTEHYDAMLKTYDCRSLLELTMSIYVKRQDAQSQKRRLSSVDEAFQRKAEDLLFSELACALDLPREEVQPFIAARLEGRPS